MDDPKRKRKRSESQEGHRSSRDRSSYRERGRRDTTVQSHSEARRDSRRERDSRTAPVHNMADARPQSASRRAARSSGLAIASNIGRQQPSKSRQDAPQSTQPLESGKSYTYETLDDKLKQSGEFNRLRQLLEDELDRLGLIYPQDSRYRYSTRYAEINDIIVFPHIEFCGNKNFQEEEHSWLPAPGGYLLIKYRRAVILERCQGDLKVGTFTTFSKTGMEEKRKQTVFDEVQRIMVPSLSRYVHTVVADHSGKTKDCPECFMGGLPVRYRTARGCRVGQFKNSYTNPYTPYIMSNETPFLVVGHVEDSTSAARLDLALDATIVRTRSARVSATEAMREKERWEERRSDALRGAQPERYYTNNGEHQASAFKEGRYNDNSRSSLTRAAQQSQLDRYHANNREQQASAFNEDMYDDHSESSLMQPLAKRPRRDSPSYRGYVDLDAPDPVARMFVGQPALTADTSAANGTRHGPRDNTRHGPRPESRPPPNTAFGGLRVNSTANGRSALPHGGQSSTRSFRRP